VEETQPRLVGDLHVGFFATLCVHNREQLAPLAGMLDLFLSSGNGRHKDQIAELVPSAQRRGYLKTLATQLKAVRPR